MEDLVAKRLLIIRNELRLSQREMATIVGVSHSAWQKMEAGGSVPSGQTLQKVADQGFSPTWVLTGEGGMRLRDASFEISQAEPGRLESVSQWVAIPHLDVVASAGGGAAETDGHVIEPIMFPAQLLKALGLKPGKTDFINAKGDSMEPTIGDGNLLLIDRSIEGQIEDDAIYIIASPHSIYVKRLFCKLDGDLIVKSDNPRYPEQTYSVEAAANLNIIGRVRWVAKSV